MKKPLFAAALISALVACSVPAKSYGSDVQPQEKETNTIYTVFVGRKIECFQQAIKGICEYLENNDILFTEISCTPQKPDNQSPEPDDNEINDTTQPDNQNPETPSQPDNQNPEIPSQPDNQSPVTPSQPDNQNPEIPSQPETPAAPTIPVQPDTSVSETNVHPYVIEILNLVNAERVKAGLDELKLDMDVTAAANVRAKEIKQLFSHSRPNGTSFSTALTEQGISYRSCGENIAWGQKSPEQVVTAWMNSEGHRANILNKNFKNIGIGYYQDEKGVNHWVQLFTN